MHELLAEMKERVASIEDALTQLEQPEHTQTGLHYLQAHLLNLLELIERDAGITAAADDLIATATAFIQGDHPARARLLREAFQPAWCRDQGCGRTDPSPNMFRRCGRSSGVPGPACG